MVPGRRSRLRQLHGASLAELTRPNGARQAEPGARAPGFLFGNAEFLAERSSLKRLHALSERQTPSARTGKGQPTGRAALASDSDDVVREAEPSVRHGNQGDVTLDASHCSIARVAQAFRLVLIIKTETAGTARCGCTCGRLVVREEINGREVSGVHFIHQRNSELAICPHLSTT